MEQTYNAADAKAFILRKFTEQGDFLEIVNAETLSDMVGSIISFDEAYMHESGVDDGGVYDDDAAYEFIYKKLCQKYADYKMYLMRLAEDYLDYNEQYLESIGAIEWE